MARLSIEVIFATRERQEIVSVALEAGARAIDALRASRLCERYPEIDARSPRLGIFGKEVAPDALLADGDRVEIYRPLAIDPKDARRARAGAKSHR